MIYGIDVSKYQGQINWSDVKSGGIITVQKPVSFVLVKASDDVGEIDPRFDSNLCGARDTATVTGLYHFVRSDLVDYRHSVEFIYGVIKSRGGLLDGELICPDFERGIGDQWSYCWNWIRYCYEVFGFWPLPYSAHWWGSQHYFEGHPETGDLSVWWALYGRIKPPCPMGFKQVAIWQFTDKGQVHGIKAPVDLDCSDLSLEELRNLGRPYESKGK